MPKDSNSTIAESTRTDASGSREAHGRSPFDAGERQCIHCGRCLEVCPLFAATGSEELSPRAKFALARAVDQGLEGLDHVSAADLAGLCLSCGRCVEVCAQGLCAPDLAANLRRAWPGWESWVWRAWIGGKALWPAAVSAARVVPRLAGRAEQARHRLAVLGRGGAAPEVLAVSAYGTCAGDRKTVLFPGCLATSVKSAWTDKARDLLCGLGLGRESDPAWTCCGATLGHAGLEDAARDMRRTNIRAWREAGRPRVAVFCASCLRGLAAYADDDDDFEPGEAGIWTEALTPLSSFLADTGFTVLDTAPERILFHRPCHDEDDHDGTWLGRVLEGRLQPGDSGSCCGLGGVMQLGRPDLSDRVARDCWQGLNARTGDVVATGCSGCVSQLAATAPEGVAVAHWLELVRP